MIADVTSALHQLDTVASIPQLLGLPDDPEAWLLDCSHDLQLLADIVRARLAETDSDDDDTRIDRATNSIIRYVMDKTGQPDTAEAAVLIGAVRLERAPAELDAVRTPRGAAGASIRE